VAQVDDDGIRIQIALALLQDIFNHGTVGTALLLIGLEAGHRHPEQVGARL
jgi:hypothetical protein